MPEKHLIDTLIFIFCATSAQKNLFIFSVPSAFAWGYAPFPKFLDPPLERKKEAARQGGREGGGQAGREGGQAGGDGGHADPVLLNTFHLVLTYSTREWDTTLL